MGPGETVHSRTYEVPEGPFCSWFLAATLRQVVDSLRAHVPDLQISYVDTPIMNQLSYEVLADNIAGKGFVPNGDMVGGIEATIKLLRQAGGFAG